MLMEILFCIMFFILPLAGMCITLLISGCQEEHTDKSKQLKNSKYINSQSRIRHMRGVTIKIEDKHSNYFFKQWRNKGVHSCWILDTS